ncbi:MAG: SWIM zinc finger domain-containing protein [Bacteroidia bacterium]
MTFTEEQIAQLAPKPNAFQAGKKLSPKAKWDSFGHSEEALWGAIRGSGSKPYLTRIDLQDLAYKCSCPSRQFPCKHALALMLLMADEGKGSPASTPPEWVEDWLETRRNRNTPKAAPSKATTTPADLERKKKAQQKRQEARIKSVDAGVDELSQWLHDLMRVGLLELPEKTHDLEQMAARMVDAKASGLAGRLKSLAYMGYNQPEVWQPSAMAQLGKLHTLLEAWKNREKFSSEWQLSLKNLIGWPQSGKDLMDNAEAFALKDHWLVLGQELSYMDELVIQRIWLWGCHTSTPAFVLNFGTVFAPLENKILAGTIIDADVAFFPGAIRQRAIIRKQFDVSNEMAHQLKGFESWQAILEKQAEQIATNPWLEQQQYILHEARITAVDGSWMIIDSANKLMPIVSTFDVERCLQWRMISGQQTADLAFVMRENEVLPLGIYHNRAYHLL